MKKSLKLRKKLFFSILLISMILSGCGSDNSTTQNVVADQNSSEILTTVSIDKNLTISGKVVDGEISGATIFLDLNKNYKLDNGEPKTISQSDGKYSLIITTEVQKNENFLNKTSPLIAYGGKDIRTGENFKDALMAMIEDENEIFITPFSTLIAQSLLLELKKSSLNKIQKSNKIELSYVKQKISKIKEKISLLFGLKVSILNRNPIELAKFGDNSLLSKSLQLHQSATQIKEAMRVQTIGVAISIFETYSALGETIIKLEEDVLKNEDNILIIILDKTVKESNIFDQSLVADILKETINSIKEIDTFWEGHEETLSDNALTNTIKEGEEVLNVATPTPSIPTATPIPVPTPTSVPTAMPTPTPTPTPTPIPVATTVPTTTEEQRKIVERHNYYRNLEFTDSPLIWDSTLASHAQQWADYLATNYTQADADAGEIPHASIYHRNTHGLPYQGEGENIAWARPARGYMTPNPVDITVSGTGRGGSIDAWANEKADYDYSSNSGNGAVVGHYTQIVWQKTTKVGCGKTNSTTDYGGEYVVCRYSIAGNMIGDKPYCTNYSLAQYYNDTSLLFTSAMIDNQTFINTKIVEDRTDCTISNITTETLVINDDGTGTFQSFDFFNNGGYVIDFNFIKSIDSQGVLHMSGTVDGHNSVMTLKLIGQDANYYNVQAEWTLDSAVSGYERSGIFRLAK